MKGFTNLQILDHTQGRFGNQLFRVSTIIGMALKNNSEYYIPIEWEHSDLFPNLKNKISKFEIDKNIKKKHNEVSFAYHDIPYFEDELLEIVGYFQSYKYFEGNDSVIKNSFLINKNSNYDFSEDKIRLCIHVRHGDFYDKNVGGGHKGNEEYHPVMTINFYINSINKILSLTKIDEFLVFTDHPETKNFIFGEFEIFNIPIKYFDYSDDYISDFIAQKNCDHFIIPNSTFSWWSSFLSEKNKNKIVCCPMESDWLGPRYSHFDKSTLLPKDWLRIEQ